MRLIFWFLLVANVGLIVFRYGVGLPESFREPSPAGSVVVPALSSAARIDLLVESSVSPAPKKEPGSPSARLLELRPFCKMLGPFGAESMAAKFVDRLKAWDVKSKVHDVALPSGVSYWVYLDPLESRDQAHHLLAELRLRDQERGEDSYIIPKGDLANGISLGLYSRKSLADDRVAELKQVGFRPKIQKIDRPNKEVWVLLFEGEDQKIGDSGWKSLLKGNNHLKEQQIVCLDVDSQ